MFFVCKTKQKMLELLTDRDKLNISKWSYSVSDKSITTKYLGRFWDAVVELVPHYVAPNVLTLAGLVLLVYSYHIAYLYSNIYPKLVSLVSAILIFGYQTMDSIDGKQARRTKNSSPLGELFDHSCDSVGTIFVILTTATVLGIKSPTILFYVTQTGLMLFLLEHLKAFRTKVLEFSEYNGPGEILSVCIFILLFKGLTGWSVIPQVILHNRFFMIIFVIIYWCVYVECLSFTAFNKSIRKLDFNIFLNMDKLWNHDKHYGTRVGVLLCLSMRCINGVFLWYNLIVEWDLQDVIAHGLVLSVVITDLIVSKMASRELHPIVVIGSMLSVFNHNILIFVLVCVYYLKIFYELCDSLGLLLFTPSRNVYICGVWDMLHLGHMKHFQEVSKLGNRLLVGVHSDQEVKEYKRTPVLTMEERLTTARMCKGVSEVIPSAPLILTEEFLIKHNVHVVACSAEYDDPDDVYYEAARKLGILNVIERIDGISTTELLERVKSGSDKLDRNMAELEEVVEKLENTADEVISVLKKDTEKLLENSYEKALEKDVENCIKENEKYINAQRAYYNSEDYQTDI